MHYFKKRELFFKKPASKDLHKIISGSEFFKNVKKLPLLIYFVFMFTSILADYLLLHEKFGFSVAFFKNFYLSSLDSTSEFLVFVVIIPILFILALFLVPLIVVLLFRSYIYFIEKIDIKFYISNYIIYLYIAPAVLILIDSVYKGSLLEHLPLLLVIIIYLLVVLFLSLLIQMSLYYYFIIKHRLDYLYYSVFAICFFYLFVYFFFCKKYFLLPFMLSFETILLVFYLELLIFNPILVKSDIRSFASIFAFVVALFLYITATINNSQNSWNDLNNTENIDSITGNLLLNKIYLSNNNHKIDVNISSYSKKDEICLNVGKRLVLDDNNTKAIFLSDKRRLYFRPGKNSNIICVYAVEKIPCKCKTMFRLYDIGKLEIKP